MSKEQAVHELYLLCKTLNFDDLQDMSKYAESEEELDFVRIVTDFILQQRQKEIVADKRF